MDGLINIYGVDILDSYNESNCLKKYEKHNTVNNNTNDNERSDITLDIKKDYKINEDDELAKVLINLSEDINITANRYIDYIDDDLYKYISQISDEANRYIRNISNSNKDNIYIVNI